MESKASLEIYRAGKFDIKKEHLSDNSKGSTLLFEARAGCLRTKSFMGKYTHNDRVCVVCGKETETIWHILLERDCIHQNIYEGNIRLGTFCPNGIVSIENIYERNIRLLETLGFKINTEGVNLKSVEVIKRVECSWKKSKEGNIA